MYAVGLLHEAAGGDSAALEIVTDFASRVSKYTEAAFIRLGLADTDAELVYSGGVFKDKCGIITDRVTGTLSGKFPRLRFVNARYEPVCGALLLSLDDLYGGSNGTI